MSMPTTLRFGRSNFAAQAAVQSKRIRSSGFDINILRGTHGNMRK